MRPLVSVVLPARDCGRWLQPAVYSILGQTLPDLELLVVDDGSRDGSVAALDRGDPRLRVLPARGRGIVAALNTGIAVAQGRYIARMDGDDVASPQRLERQIALLDARPEIGIAGGEVEIFTDHGPPAAGYRRYQQWVNSLRTPGAIARNLFVESPIPHPTAVLRREVVARLGGYREVPWAEDYDLWLRARAAGIPMAKPDGVILRWRDSAVRLSRHDPRCGDDAFIRARAHYLAHHLGERPLLVWGAGRYGGRLADALEREGARVRGFVDIDPRKIGNRKRGRPVRGPNRLGPPGDAFVIGAVRSAGARERIEAFLAEAGYRLEEDYLMAG